MNIYQWISIKDRMPSKEDYPIKFGGYSPKGQWVANMLNHMPDPSFGYTHWQEVSLPPPLPRDKTLADEDAQAFLDWQGKTKWATEQCAFMAALAYERAQINNIIYECEEKSMGYFLEKLKARVKGAK